MINDNDEVLTIGTNTERYRLGSKLPLRDVSRTIQKKGSELLCNYFPHQDHIECYPAWLEDRLPHFWKQSAGNKEMDHR